jgi:transmembrane protein 18
MSGLYDNEQMDIEDIQVMEEEEMMAAAEAEMELEEGGEYVGDMLGEIEEQVKQLMRDNPGNARSPETPWEMWQAFSSAVNWSQRWIQGLLAFHALLFALVIVFRNNENAQVVLFMLICVLLYFCEQINTYCAQHWEEFSTDNYFDDRGVFAGVMFAGPLLLIGLFQLVNFLRLTSTLLIKAKRMQLQQQYNAKKKGESEGAAAGSGDSGAAGAAVAGEGSSTAASKKDQ